MKNLLLISLAKSILAISIAKSGIHASANSQLTIVSVICSKDPTAVEGYRRSREKFKLNELDRQKGQFLVLLKSLLISRDIGQQNINKTSLIEYILFTNQKAIFEELTKTVSKWSAKYTKGLQLTYRPVEYPQEFKFMEVLFAPCATFRHILPTILPHKDALIYLDTDLIIFRDIQELWEISASKFRHNPEAIISASPSRTSVRKKWIPLFVSREDKVESPINSGVMIMNLTRIRQSDFLEWISMLEPHWKSFGDCGDQDILNTYLKSNQVAQMDCTWNYLSYFFRRNWTCGTNVRILHGISGFFWLTTARRSTTSGMTIFKLFDNLQLNETFQTNKFVHRIKSTLRNSAQKYCTKKGTKTLRLECKARQRINRYILG